MLPLFKVTRHDDEDDYDECGCGIEELEAVYVNYLDGCGFQCHYRNESLRRECDAFLIKSKQYSLIGKLMGPSDIQLNYGY